MKKANESKATWHECKQCGRHNDNKAKWCWYCGTNQKAVKDLHTAGAFEAVQLFDNKPLTERTP